MPKKSGNDGAPEPQKHKLEIRNEIRNYIHNERDTILRKWQCLQEALNSEERTKTDFLNKREIVKTRTIPQVIQKFIRTLKRSIRSTISLKGGTPYSVVRTMFLYWDKDKSGELGPDELRHCMASLGVKISDRDIGEIIAYYDSNKGCHEMAYDKLLADIQLDEPSIIAEVIYKGDSGREEDRFATHDDEYAVMPPLVKHFIEAVRSVLHDKMRHDGGTELSHLRHSFLMFDHDYSSALDTNELTMAMKRNLGLTITQEQAEAVVRFYDRKNAGQMSYHLLLEDVVRGQPLMLQHPELSARTIARTRDSLRSNPFVPTPFKPAPNKMVDIFRTNVRRSLDNIIRYKGGSVKSWLSKSFVAWDPQFSGFISDWRALQGSVRKLGVNISEDDAKVIMHTYDRLGDGRMDYNYLAQDILSCDPLFIVDSTSVMDLKRTATARAPPNISALVRRFKRAAEVYTRKSEGSVSARDILHGTFLRMDSSRSGHISAEELQHVCAELKVPINQEEVRQLVLWFDSNGTETMDYVLLISQLFGEDVLTRPLSLPAVGLAATQMTDSDPNAIKESLRQKALKKIQRNKLLVTERVKVKAKLEAIEKQRQALVDHKRMNQSK